ncbi:hypothetical protein IG631_00348 [Alternaria alternata]|nr:hypothetical protein IG631_00348 [Alternaria alternata]
MQAHAYRYASSSTEQNCLQQGSIAIASHNHDRLKTRDTSITTAPTVEQIQPTQKQLMRFCTGQSSNTTSYACHWSTVSSPIPEESKWRFPNSRICPRNPLPLSRLALCLFQPQATDM